jgi:hypothetical protein
MKTIRNLLFLCGVIALAACSCDKNDEKSSEFVEGYIVGSFICDEVNRESGEATGNRTERGYCILLKGSENINSPWPMNIYTFTLPTGLFTFPAKILAPDYNGKNCGPTFFPDSLKTKYKIRFQYRDSNGTEKINFACGPCTLMDPTFPWDNYSQVILKNTTKINQ